MTLSAASPYVPTVAELPTVTTMDALNDALAAVRRRGTEPGHLSIDLSEVRFILVECLMTIIAETAVRQRAGLATTFRLPISRDTRSFLREWEFAKTFRLATGLSFMGLVERDNLS